SGEELLRKLQAAQFVYKYGDQVCPSNWKPGADTLKSGLDLVGKI
ncbi:peroxiredoxin, partial [bacterium]|nr:peroxiredoxin [bacterium]